MDAIAAKALKLLESPEDELYLEIGRHLYGKPTIRGRGPQSPEQLIELARHWLSSKQASLAEVVCKDARLKVLARQTIPAHELVVAVCGALDLISHLLGSVPAITVAVLLVRLGLHQFCSGVWETERNK